MAVSPVHHEKLARNQIGLRSPGWLGRWPVAGVILTLFGVLLFGLLAVAVRTHNPQLLQFDIRFADDFHVLGLNSLPVIRGLMIFGYYLGQEIIVGIGAVLVLYFIYRRFWTELWMVLIAWGGEAAIWLLVSDYFGRPRPVFAFAVWHQMTAPSFPSGHCFGAVLCFGLLGYMLIPKMSTRFWKAIVVGTALAIIFYVGFSRLFVGDHYPSDVLAGYGIGLAWGAFVYTIVEYIARRHKPHETITS